MAAARRRCATPRPSIGFLAQHFVLLEPGDRLVPGVLGRLLAAARAEGGVEAVPRAGIALEFGSLFGGLEFLFHLLDLLDFDASVLGAIETEHRLLHLRREFDRALRHRIALVDQAAVERDAGLEVLVVARIVPDVAPAAAEPH